MRLTDWVVIQINSRRKEQLFAAIALVLFMAFIINHTLPNKNVKETAQLPHENVIKNTESTYESVTEAEIVRVTVETMVTETTAEDVVIEPEIEATISRQQEDLIDTIKHTAEEKELFIRVVSAEAGADWCIDGYRLLAAVTINQLNSGLIGDTLRDVLLYPNNYSVIDNGRYLSVPISDLAVQAVAEVLSGNEYLPSGVQWYCTTAVRHNNFHSKLTVYTQYDNVLFFSK
jgi:cell division protein FtsI/penicillin-binding protein 2